METVDLTKVAGFQAVDSEGNVLGTVSMEQLTDSIASKLASELSVQNSAMPAIQTMSATTMAATTSTGSDKMETAFSETTDPAYVRVIDKKGNSAKQGISSLASVVGGLLGTVTSKKDGLMLKDDFFCKGRIIGIDLDELFNGIFLIQDCVNIPDGIEFNYGFLLSFCPEIKSSSNYRCQIFLSSTGLLFKRICWGTWENWVKIA